MSKRSNNLMLAVSAAGIALLACSLTGRKSPTEPPVPTTIEATSAPADGGTDAEEFNPFLPTATPTVDVEAMHESIHVTGTISARLDGDPSEWQTGSVESGAGSMDLSSWQRAPLTTFEDVYQFEIYAIDPASLDEAAKAGNVGSGTKTLTISFSIQSPTAGQSLTLSLPSEGLTSAEMSYLVPEEGDQFGRFVMTAGELNLELIQVEPGQSAQFEGTFSGTLTYAGELGAMDDELDPERTIEVRKGQLSIQSIPYDPIFD